MRVRLVPYLAVRDARAAIAWYTDALGAQVVGDPYVMDDDRIGHAELTVAGATFYLSDEYPEMGLTGPDDGRVSVSLHLTVPDVDAAVDRAVRIGATLSRPVSDAPYGRTGVIIDPYGHRWILQTPAHAAAPGPRPGDAVYLTLQVPDGARARDFYEAVLGWSAAPGRVPDGWQVEGTTPMTGIGGGATRTGRGADVRRRRHRGRRGRRADGGRARPATSTGSRTGSPPSAATTRACRSTSASWADVRMIRWPDPDVRDRSGPGSLPTVSSPRRTPRW